MSCTFEASSNFLVKVFFSFFILFIVLISLNLTEVFERKIIIEIHKINRIIIFFRKIFSFIFIFNFNLRFFFKKIKVFLN